MSEPKKRWIGVDLDGTLAIFGCDWPNDYKQIGEPVMPMVKKVRQWIADGEDVKIFTARMDCFHPIFGHVSAEDVRRPIEEWCLKHLGKVLPITNRKDYWCKAIYDDRARQVETDTGRIIGEEQ
jgi:hypothetical protein